MKSCNTCKYKGIWQKCKNTSRVHSSGIGCIDKSFQYWYPKSNQSDSSIYGPTDALDYSICSPSPSYSSNSNDDDGGKLSSGGGGDFGGDW